MEGFVSRCFVLHARPKKYTSYEVITPDMDIEVAYDRIMEVLLLNAEANSTYYIEFPGNLFILLEYNDKFDTRRIFSDDEQYKLVKIAITKGLANLVRYECPILSRYFVSKLKAI